MTDDPVWARCAPYISDALEYAGGSHTLADVWHGIEGGGYQLWPGERSAIVTEMLQTPGHLTLHFFLAGGSLPELEGMLPVILAWGREQGCTRASLLGRHGWQRTFLRRLGWRPTAVLMETPLDG